MDITNPEDLFDLRKIPRIREGLSVVLPPVAEPPPRRRVIRDRDALRVMRGEPAPIDAQARVDSARTTVRDRTARALESLGVEEEARAARAVRAAPIAGPPRWRVAVLAPDIASRALEFFVAGSDLFDAVQRGSAAIASWMREHHAGAAWRVESVEDVGAALLV